MPTFFADFMTSSILTWRQKWRVSENRGSHGPIYVKFATHLHLGHKSSQKKIHIHTDVFDDVMTSAIFADVGKIRQNCWRQSVGKNVGIDPKFFMWTRMAQRKEPDKFYVNRSIGTLFSRYTSFLTSPSKIDDVMTSAKMSVWIWNFCADFVWPKWSSVTIFSLNGVSEPCFLDIRHLRHFWRHRQF